MERGKLDFGSLGGPITIVIFDDQLAHLVAPKLERLALRRERWTKALACWEIDQPKLDFTEQLIRRYNLNVDVVTWRPRGFADELGLMLYERGVPVREVRSDTYDHLSPAVAQDRSIQAVYDPNPEHRWGYGWKCRELTLGVPY